MLAVVEEELVQRTEHDGEHHGWRHLGLQECIEAESICEEALDEHVKVRALRGEVEAQFLHEWRVVLHRARRHPVPPILKWRRHLAMERAVDHAKTEGLPDVKPDQKLVDESHPWECG